MKLPELKAFDAFMTHGSTKAAASVLGIGQPVVSRQLASLENRVGFALFIRKRNHLTPTPEAYQFHESVSRMLAQFDQIQADARAIANKQMGNIVIAAQPIFCDTFLLDAVARFRVEHPGVSVRLVDAGMEVLLRMLAERNCDMALGITLETEVEGIRTTPLARCEARCVMPTGHRLNQPGPIPLPRLRSEPFVELAAGSPLRTRVENMMQRIEVERNIAAEMRHLSGVCALVGRGVGVAIADPVVELLLNPHEIVSKPLIPTIDWEIAMMEPRDRPLSTVAQELQGFILYEIDGLIDRGVVQRIGEEIEQSSISRDSR
ncbi:LysR family transcriptional regulator [Qingshengfaniella alkalisoli]|uniref:LysR family transcriptional regulator n=1 Tax=Qingshengfaniella alkalisoli TaxID=2599296 RepID=A0A5B8I9X0_9RHOB|nr:LysR family transcriptional regulator [Qingshengfaniella alkalisoli]QDY71145.1 LysR family transcriptional regulator [Qingshengfaniella alkalisoli]